MKYQYCMYCGRAVKKGEGGSITVPMVLSHKPPMKVCLHNGCLKPYLQGVEKTRPPLPEKFEPAAGAHMQQWNGRVGGSGCNR